MLQQSCKALWILISNPIELSGITSAQVFMALAESLSKTPVTISTVEIVKADGKQVLFVHATGSYVGAVCFFLYGVVPTAFAWVPTASTWDGEAHREAHQSTAHHGLCTYHATPLHTMPHHMSQQSRALHVPLERGARQHSTAPHIVT